MVLALKRSPAYKNQYLSSLFLQTLFNANSIVAEELAISLMNLKLFKLLSQHLMSLTWLLISHCHAPEQSGWM